MHGAPRAGIGEAYVLELHRRRQVTVDGFARGLGLDQRRRVQNRVHCPSGGLAEHALMYQRTEIP